MKRIKRFCQLSSWIIVGLAFIGTSSCFVYGAEGEPLPPGIVIGDDKGIQVQSDGNYLVEINNVLPGKKWTIDVNLMSVDKGTPYDLSIRLLKPTVEGPIDFSKAIRMTMDYNGKKIYDGPASGISKELNLQESTYSLGTFRSGDSRRLHVTFEMDSTYTKDDFQVKSVMENIWAFRAVKNHEPESIKTSETKKQVEWKKPTTLFPRTGEEWRNVLIYTCLGLFVMLMALLIAKKKYEEQKNAHK
ncbi:LPXTG cell wall anchor domain-containing protein [Candidatus Enterococcus mansonii]|uniref:Uncharacterized protein n=1 Tax=Candidatus Enterococcus mansonii TaxID=1834181 RepID=A0A242CHQ4_9ENTE|nr:LPXTG cell wall anchor domain-containing protein [Enterococcus sp. 4G2_DIV0659]OTO09658.1 hypothetical protein A5880_000338 [Enterococcus sp. 4G2_DIV0659]